MRFRLQLHAFTNLTQSSDDATTISLTQTTDPFDLQSKFSGLRDGNLADLAGYSGLLAGYPA